MGNEQESVIQDGRPIVEEYGHESMPWRKKLIGAKILVVDDEPDILMGLSMRLGHAGYKVVTARDGAEATKVAVQEKPDLVLLDIGIPCGDGHVVCRRLGNSVHTITTPVIYLTARTAAVDKMEAMTLGAFDYITKPFTSERLLTAVERALYGINANTDFF